MPTLFAHHVRRSNNHLKDCGSWRVACWRDIGVTLACWRTGRYAALKVQYSFDKTIAMLCVSFSKRSNEHSPPCFHAARWQAVASRGKRLLECSGCAHGGQKPKPRRSTFDHLTTTQTTRLPLAGPNCPSMIPHPPYCRHGSAGQHRHCLKPLTTTCITLNRVQPHDQCATRSVYHLKSLGACKGSMRQFYLRL